MRVHVALAIEFEALRVHFVSGKASERWLLKGAHKVNTGPSLKTMQALKGPARNNSWVYWHENHHHHVPTVDQNADLLGVILPHITAGIGEDVRSRVTSDNKDLASERPFPEGMR